MALILLLVAAAFNIWNSYIVMSEDVFFGLRQAYNLTVGYGMVYNPGEYYDTGTNFLWVILLTPSFLFGWEPIIYIRVISMLIALAVLALVYVVTERLDNRKTALFAVLLLATHYSFFIMATHGFAPHLVSLPALAAIVLSMRLASGGGGLTALAVGLCIFILMATRLDAGLMFAVLWPLAVWVAWRYGNSPKHNVALVGVTPLVLLAAYLSWRFWYYGDVLPVTYYTKLGAIPDSYDTITHGATYLWRYAREYWLIFLFPVFAYGGWRRIVQAGYFQHFRPTVNTLVTLALAAIVVLSWAYMLHTGGDYTEFRFMVPSSPFLFILFARTLVGIADRRVAGAVIAVMIFASFYHQANYNESGRAREWGKHGALAHPINIAEHIFLGWEIIGRGLAKIFAEFGEYSPDVRIATSNGGNVAFYSRLYVWETSGFTNKQVFEEDNHVPLPDPKGLAGHHIQTTPDFLQKMGIHLVIGSPQAYDERVNILAVDGKLAYWVGRLTHMGEMAFQYKYPRDMQVVELPVAKGKKIVALYLTRTKVLDDFFRRNNYKTYDVFAPNGSLDERGRTVS